MAIQIGDIVNQIVVTEPVVVNSIKVMGDWVNIGYTGKTSNIFGTRIERLLTNFREIKVILKSIGILDQ